MKNFRNLRDEQVDVFGQIAINQDGGHNPKTVDSLLRKGLVICEEVPMVGACPPTVVKRYYVPIAVHAEWCQWCADNLISEEE